MFVSGTLVSSAQRADVEGVTLARKLSAQRGGQGEHVPFPQEGLATPEEQGGGLKRLNPTGATTYRCERVLLTAAGVSANSPQQHTVSCWAQSVAGQRLPWLT